MKRYFSKLLNLKDYPGNEGSSSRGGISTVFVSSSGWRVSRGSSSSGRSSAVVVVVVVVGGSSTVVVVVVVEEEALLLGVCPVDN